MITKLGFGALLSGGLYVVGRSSSILSIQLPWGKSKEEIRASSLNKFDHLLSSESKAWLFLSTGCGGEWEEK
jgi:hypothetical protein